MGSEKPKTPNPEQLREAIRQVFGWALQQDSTRSIAKHYPAALMQFSVVTVLGVLFKGTRRPAITNPGGYLLDKLRDLKPEDVEAAQRAQRPPRIEPHPVSMRWVCVNSARRMPTKSNDSPPWPRLRPSCGRKRARVIRMVAWRTSSDG